MGIESHPSRFAALVAHFHHYQQPLVLTGAGCSTASGIPDYRDKNGHWKHRQPVQFNDFINSESVRKRYWARSMHGWPGFHDATPGNAHIALANLEADGWIRHIITQNIDGLHQVAGSRNVIDLHGKLHTLSCIDCGYQTDRNSYQEILLAWNPQFICASPEAAPDGDSRS